MHALIIEQDAWVVLMIEDALADAGYISFDVAGSGADAMALAEKRCPDLITSDVRLGACSSIDTVRSICTKRCIPVVVTASGWEVRQTNRDLAVVQKPFSPEN